MAHVQNAASALACFFPVFIEQMDKRRSSAYLRGNLRRRSPIPFDSDRCASPIPFLERIGEHNIQCRSSAAELMADSLPAYRLSVALGARQLLMQAPSFSRDVKELDLATAELAACELIRRLFRWTRIARLFATRHPPDAADIMDRLVPLALAARTEALAAYLAIDAAYAAASGPTSDLDAPTSGNAFDRLLDALDVFDAALQRCEVGASAFARCPAAARWRRMLAGPHREIPPWWLDDTTFN
jgi:hypothetical protein